MILRFNLYLECKLLVIIADIFAERWIVHKLRPYPTFCKNKIKNLRKLNLETAVTYDEGLLETAIYTCQCTLKDSGSCCQKNAERKVMREGKAVALIFR